MDLRQLNPYIVQWGLLQIRWYGLFMAISMGIGLWYLLRAGERRGLRQDFLSNWGLAAILGGVVGARLMFVITNPVFFLHHPAEIPLIELGGLSIHGGLLGGILAAWWYARRNHVPLSPLADLAVPGIAVGIFLVRFGNIFNHEILGYHAAILGGYRHPVQLYESAIGVLLLLLYRRWSRQDHPDGYRFWSAILVYSYCRFTTEFFRVQNPHYLVNFVVPYLGIGGITLTQWVTPAIVALAVVARRHTVRAGMRWRVPDDGTGDAAGAGAHDEPSEGGGPLPGSATDGGDAADGLAT